MRAAIACIKCRRSKTKCNNKGNGTACETCVANKHRCEYQNAQTTGEIGSYPRRESTNGDVENAPRKRKRPLASAVGATIPSYNSIHEDVLDAAWLTSKLWKELFEIYERHFASDFPFLHKRRFLRPLNQPLSVDSKQISTPHPRPPHGPPLLLAFLALTARYHPEVVSRVGHKPIATAEYFAEAARKQLGALPGKASLERAQALLFLGNYHWTELEGEQGWTTIGIAIRYTQVLGFQHDDVKEYVDGTNSDEIEQQEDFINREVERRTFWSCFIMDRLMSCGDQRPQMLNVAKFRIQLPCSDGAFRDGSKVKTRFLGEDNGKYAERRQRIKDDLASPGKHQEDITYNEEEWEVGKDEGELSLYIRAVANFGKITEWALDSGRRRETKPPWHSESGFKKLEDEHLKFKAALPKRLTLTHRNTESHIANGTVRTYLLIHAVHSLCTINLYREYMAFLPWHVKTPKGPLDEPLIKEDLPKDKPNYWVGQARECFGAAKDFHDLLKACQSADALVDTPIAGFATYIVAWCACYCHFFPRMDPDRVLNSRNKPSVWETAVDRVIDMAGRLKMASQWIDFLIRLHLYLIGKRAEWKRCGGSPGSISSDEEGGLREYVKVFEHEHKNIGSITDDKWESKPFNPDHLKLEHDPDSDERTEFRSPSVYKSESTPVQTPKFTSVNRASTELEPTNSTTTLPPLHHAGQPPPSQLGPVTSSSTRSPYPLHGTLRHQPIPSPSDQNIITTPIYYSSPAAYGAMPQVGRDPYAIEQSQHPVPEYNTPYWGPSPANYTEINNMELAGQPSIGMQDLGSMIRADNAVGNANEPFPNYNQHQWIGHIPPSNAPLAYWDGNSFGPYSHVNVRQGMGSEQLAHPSSRADAG